MSKYKPTMNLRIVEWWTAQGGIIRSNGPTPMKLEEVLEQMWVNEETGEVDWRELETVSAKEAGYLDDSPSPNSGRDQAPPKKRVRTHP